MKTQAVSNQNFKGNIVFVEKAGERTTGTLADYVTKKVGIDGMNKLSQLVKNEPFDLFISKSQSHPGNLNIEADVNLFEAIQNRSKKGFIASVPLNKIEWLPESAKNAVLFYKNFINAKKVNMRNVLENYIQTRYNVTI